MTKARKISGNLARVRAAVMAFALALGTALTPLMAWAGSDVASSFIIFDNARPLPEVRFQDARVNERSLTDFRGKIVLLNIWATWCLPCREEMPALDRLEGQLGGADFAIVPLAMDKGGIAPVRDFFAEVGIENLPIYVDDTFRSARALRVHGIPTTLLLDREGRQVGRLIGPADWGDPEAVIFLRKFLERE